MIVPVEPHQPVTDLQWRVLADLYPSTHWILAAMRLAATVETCRALVAGEPVDRDLLDQDGVEWARERAVVLAPATSLLGLDGVAAA